MHFSKSIYLIIINDSDKKIKLTFQMQCLPIYSILLALDNPTVDYMSLDVEGAEEGILQSIPWDKVNIKVIGLEIIIKKHDERADGEHHNPYHGIYDLLAKNDYILFRADWHDPTIRKSMEAYFVKSEVAKNADQKISRQSNVDFCEEPFKEKMCPK